jgi:ABC-type transport system substrate-binding protein
MEEVLLAVAGYWEAIGLDTKLVEQGIQALIKLPTREMSGEVGGWTLASPFEPWEQYMIDQFYSESRGMVHYESPEMDALVEQTLAAPVEDRPELMVQMMQHIYDEYVIVPLLWGDKLWVKGENVGRWETMKWQTMDLLLDYVQHPTPLNTFRLFDP